MQITGTHRSPLPTIEQITSRFGQVEAVDYSATYPRVEVLTSDGQLWFWDRWHGGGVWELL